MRGDGLSCEKVIKVPNNQALIHHSLQTKRLKNEEQQISNVTCPSKAWIALEAPSLETYVTKPNPLDLPVSWSIMILATINANFSQHIFPVLMFLPDTGHRHNTLRSTWQFLKN